MVINTILQNLDILSKLRTFSNFLNITGEFINKFTIFCVAEYIYFPSRARIAEDFTACTHFFIFLLLTACINFFFFMDMNAYIYPYF